MSYEKEVSQLYVPCLSAAHTGRVRSFFVTGNNVEGSCCHLACSATCSGQSLVCDTCLERVRLPCGDAWESCQICYGRDALDRSSLAAHIPSNKAGEKNFVCFLAGGTAREDANRDEALRFWRPAIAKAQQGGLDFLFFDAPGCPFPSLITLDGATAGEDVAQLKDDAMFACTVEPRDRRAFRAVVEGVFRDTPSKVLSKTTSEDVQVRKLRTGFYKAFVFLADQSRQSSSAGGWRVRYATPASALPSARCLIVFSSPACCNRHESCPAHAKTLRLYYTNPVTKETYTFNFVVCWHVWCRNMVAGALACFDGKEALVQQLLADHTARDWQMS